MPFFIFIYLLCACFYFYICKTKSQKNNIMRTILAITITVFGFALLSCSTVKLPQYTTVDKLTQVNAGMTKAQVYNVLGIYPWDILQNQKDGCVIHVFKYKHTKKKAPASISETREGLVIGEKRYGEESSAYIIYRKNKVETVYTEESKKDLLTLIMDNSLQNDACGNPEYGIVKGCTDPESINYNPDATVDDDKCEYCPCGSIKNPEYNPKRKNNCDPCIKPKEEVKCGNCEMLDKILENSKEGKINVDLNISK